MTSYIFQHMKQIVLILRDQFKICILSSASSNQDCLGGSDTENSQWVAG